MSYLQPVVFKLNNESYGMDIDKVSAIEKGQKIVRVPNSSSNIKGIINLRGEVIPVIDLKAKFNMLQTETIPTEESELIIVNLESMKIALLVDTVNDIQNINADDIVNMPVIAKGQEGQFFDKVAKLDGQLIILIDPVKLLSTEETQFAEQLIDSSAQ